MSIRPTAARWSARRSTVAIATTVVAFAGATAVPLLTTTASAQTVAPGPPPASTSATVTFRRLGAASVARHHSVQFTGRVHADGGDAGDLQMTIEVRASEGWQPVAVVHTRGSGGFSWRHMFSTKGRFVFRARLSSGQGFDPTPDPSPTTSVRVH